MTPLKRTPLFAKHFLGKLDYIQPISGIQNTYFRYTGTFAIFFTFSFAAFCELGDLPLCHYAILLLSG